MVESTAGDIVARMALVPRTLEARGLDATPPMQARLRRAGDLRAVEILDVILRDEVGHVAMGNHWYRWLCERDGLDPDGALRRCWQRGTMRRACVPPSTCRRGLGAGFTPEEIARWQAGAWLSRTAGNGFALARTVTLAHFRTTMTT
jgi:uncharacterized ferritin-like protein (DUF455 family)